VNVQPLVTHGHDEEVLPVVVAAEIAASAGEKIPFDQFCA
jgi:hypothetical protein